MSTAAPRTYPRKITVGGDTLTLRPMTAADAEVALAFARTLPTHDLLFLRRDITRPDSVAIWMQGIERGRITTILAESPGGDRDNEAQSRTATALPGPVRALGGVGGHVGAPHAVVHGYATIDRGDLSWSPHVAEMRVMVSAAMRGKGLGRLLTQEGFAVAVGLGIEKIIAQMTVDQKGAIAVFEGMGFRPEALLRDHVKDREGRTHDLLILSHDVARFQSQMDAYGVTEALGG